MKALLNAMMIIGLFVSTQTSLAREMPMNEVEILDLFISQIHELEWEVPIEWESPTESRSVSEDFASTLLTFVNTRGSSNADVHGMESSDGPEISASCRNNRDCTVGIVNGSVHAYQFRVKRLGMGYYKIDSKVTPIRAN